MKKVDKSKLIDNLKIKFDKILFQKIANITLWILLFTWMGICIIDFIVVKTNNNPLFCLSTKINQYDDGKVNSCLGLGYKVLQYDREGYSGTEFGPFWAKDKSNS